MAEISDVMDLFKKFTMSKKNSDGTVEKEKDEEMMIFKHGLIEQLIKAMTYINKTINAAFIRDWVLKCSRYIDSTSHFFLSKRSALNSQPILFKRPNYGSTYNHKTRVLAKTILESVYLTEREFLCLMCNAFDRQQIMQEIHDPDFRLNKYTMKGFGKDGGEAE